MSRGTADLKHLVLPLAVLLSACGAPQPGSSPLPRTATSIVSTSTGVQVRLADESGGVAGLIDAAAPAVWRALPQVYEALGIRAGLLDDGAMVFGTNRYTGQRIGDRPTSSFVRCAGTGSGRTSPGGYRVRLAIRSEVRDQADGRALLVTSVAGSGTTVEGTSTAPIRCVSNGELEELIASLAARIATRS